jgi:hypothetical protein
MKPGHLGRDGRLPRACRTGWLQAEGPPPSDEWLAEVERAERCRIAQVAAIVALQEVQATASVGAGAEAS